MKQLVVVASVLACTGCSVRDDPPTGPPPVSIVTVTLPDAHVGQAYDVQLDAVGGSGTFAWAVSGTAIPPGLQLSSSGHLSGVPSRAGTYTVGIQASSQTAWDVRNFTLSVLSSLEIENPSDLPEAILGEPYEVRFTVRGGTPPLEWSIAWGGIPLWTSLDPSTGVLRGTPTSIGSALFALHVRSPSTNEEALKAFTLNSRGP